MLREFAANLPGIETVEAIRRTLNANGLRVEQSFDLRAALTLTPSCTCPHHGTALCDCQYTVLLVYRQTSSAPVTLVVHGRDNQSSITASDPPDGQPSAGLSFEIVQALATARLIVLNDDGEKPSAASAAQ